MAHFVLFETGGNQRFIFATNKLAENLGASQMIWDAGLRLVLEVVEDRTGQPLFDADPRIMRANIRNQPQLGDGENDIEVVTAASGKAILLVNDEGFGRDLVYAATRRCLEDLPGVDLRGLVSRRFDLDADNLDDEMRAVHERLAALSGTFPGAEFRFLRLPVIAGCATSNLPASSAIDAKAPESVSDRPETRLRSAVSYRKRSYRGWAADRLRASLNLEAIGLRLPLDLDKLEKLSSEIDWLAVIHADGNGLGAVFQNFGEKAQSANNRDYIDKLRKFSLALDDCTEAAARAALIKAHRRIVNRLGSEHAGTEIRAVPLVLGGDDLTMVSDGRIGLRITHDFLKEFAEQAIVNKDIQAVVKNLPAPLTASAGVAIVKPHFPFHLAYELAEALLRSAKRKKPKGAIDFLVHYDASGSDLRQIRDRLIVGDAQIFARPYAIDKDCDWIRFAQTIGMLNGEPDPAATPPAEDEEPIPRSLLHELRSALFFGRSAGEEQLASALARRGAADRRLRDLLKRLHDEVKLFQKNPDKNPKKVEDRDKPDWRSFLLDVLEAQEFWQ